MPTRRDLMRSSLKSAALVALSPTVPTFLARSARAAGPKRDGRVLVIIQLDGGNDAINTLVPFTDPGYAKNRTALRIPEKQLIKVSNRVGLNPGMRDLGKLFDRGELALVPGVGYPNPNRSHFESMSIWQTARLDLEEHRGSGWIGRAFDEQVKPADAPLAAGAASLYIGSGSTPSALRGRRAGAASLEQIEDLALPAGWDPQPAQARLRPQNERDDSPIAYVRRSVLDAYASSQRVDELIRRKTAVASGYPDSALANKLKTIGQLLKADLGARVFYTSQSSYDTHLAQMNMHYGLLSELSGAIYAFFNDLSAAKLAERVTVMCFSEFGRRVAENGSAGTDHGTAGLVILAGPGVRPGVHGTVPSLTDLVDGDLKVSTDFRRVYAASLEEWLGLPSLPALGSRFEPMPLFRTRPA